MTDLDPPDVRRRLGEADHGIHHARVAYARSRAGTMFVAVTVATLLSAIAGWTAAELFVGPASGPSVAVVGAVGGGLLGLAAALRVLLAGRSGSADEGE